MEQTPLWVLACLVGTVGLVIGCDRGSSVHYNPRCGDGVAEDLEECDVDDLDGQTCADVVPGTSGVLACTSSCTFDVSHCDPGGACGDGVVEAVEECDCGNPALISTVPPQCLDFNGSPLGTCNDDCTELPECSVSLFEECSPLVGEPPTHGCCPDEWGVPTECKASPFAGSDNLCARSCTTASQCPWNQTCLVPLDSSFDLCFLAYCGPGELVDASFHGACQAPGGQPGYCAPFGRFGGSGEHYGFCIENGTLPHGAPCPPVPLLETDRYADGGAADKMCHAGLCLGFQGATGICAAFCDWQAEYDTVILGGGVQTCPADSNCFAESTLSEDQIDPHAADYGWRTTDLAYCRPQEVTDPTQGVTTCSLVTGQLLSDAGLTCADTHVSGRCEPITFGVRHGTGVECLGDPAACASPATCDTYAGSPTWGYCVTMGSELAFGSLIGACTVGTASPLGAWDPCTSATDPCPPGTWCAAEDAFDSATGPERCLPFCDTQVHDGITATCQDLGAPATTPGGVPQCASVSYSYLPWTNGTLGGPGGAADPDKSRLGFCALPRP